MKIGNGSGSGMNCCCKTVDARRVSAKQQKAVVLKCQ